MSVPVKVFLCKGQDAVDKVAQVVQKLRVVLGDKVGPVEGGVLRLRTYVQQVEPEHVCRDVCVFGVISEHAHSATL